MTKKEFAPGIPSKDVSKELPKIDSPRIWDLVAHDHLAERRGRHFDLRLGDPETGQAHSWAIPPKLPKPGERIWAIQQPTHTQEYMSFEGEIPQGYGKGQVKIHTKDKVEILNARPGHVSFNIYHGTGPEEFSLHRIDNTKWLLQNRTLSRDKISLPDSKPPYKEVRENGAARFIKDDNFLASAKLDDAHNLFILGRSGDPIKAVSYRPSKRSLGGVIEHTHKVPGLQETPVPKGLGGTILRGGLYATDPETGKAVPASTLAGLLNANVWKSRQEQEYKGKLKSVLYDVVKFKGRDMQNAPYSKKLQALKEVESSLPGLFHLPRTAETTLEKKKLIEDIRAGKEPTTEEGVVFHNLSSGTAPLKMKFKQEHDVYIKSFFPGQGKFKDKGVGGFYYSHSPDGPIVGKVGTGLSDTQRKDMHKNPSKYTGMVARVKSQGEFKSRALRAPAFEGFHLDKNEPYQLDKIKMASDVMEKELCFLWESAIE